MHKDHSSRVSQIVEQQKIEKTQSADFVNYNLVSSNYVWPTVCDSVVRHATEARNCHKLLRLISKDKHEASASSSSDSEQFASDVHCCPEYTCSETYAGSYSGAKTMPACVIRFILVQHYSAGDRGFG